MPTIRRKEDLSIYNPRCFEPTKCLKTSSAKILAMAIKMQIDNLHNIYTIDVISKFKKGKSEHLNIIHNHKILETGHDICVCVVLRNPNLVVLLRLLTLYARHFLACNVLRFHSSLNCGGA